MSWSTQVEKISEIGDMLKRTDLKKQAALSTLSGEETSITEIINDIVIESGGMPVLVKNEFKYYGIKLRLLYRENYAEILLLIRVDLDNKLTTEVDTIANDYLKNMGDKFKFEVHRRVDKGKCVITFSFYVPFWVEDDFSEYIEFLKKFVEFYGHIRDEYLSQEKSL